MEEALEVMAALCIQIVMEITCLFMFSKRKLHILKRLFLLYINYISIDLTFQEDACVCTSLHAHTHNVDHAACPLT